MKILTALGVGIAIGWAIKKPEKIKEPRFVIVDEREKLGEHFFGPEGKEVIRKFMEAHKSNL